VPFRDYAGNHISMLAKETLAEVPGQFLSFMKNKNIKPNPPRKAADPATVMLNSPASEMSATPNSVASVDDEAPPSFNDLASAPSGPPVYGQV
jgi:hypothetical protein